jgi:GNAT superfamily N-acetyltransferase
MSYSFAIENVEATYPEFEPLYRQHYAEMQARLAGQGVDIPAYNPRLKEYFDAARDGWFIHYTARLEGQPVGYGNVYLTQDMHNRQLIAQEDTLYVLPEHRNGVGKRLVAFALDDLRSRGVKRLDVTAVTDLRVAKLWQRMGFKHTAHAMSFVF